MGKFSQPDGKLEEIDLIQDSCGILLIAIVEEIFL